MQTFFIIFFKIFFFLNEVWYNIGKKGGLFMDWNVVVQAVSTFGFPIVMCGTMAYYVKYITDKHREEVSKLNEQHKQEMLDIVKAVDNNTIALTKLCEKLDKEV